VHAPNGCTSDGRTAGAQQSGVGRPIRSGKDRGAQTTARAANCAADFRFGVPSWALPRAKCEAGRSNSECRSAGTCFACLARDTFKNCPLVMSKAQEDNLTHAKRPRPLANELMSFLLQSSLRLTDNNRPRRNSISSHRHLTPTNRKARHSYTILTYCRKIRRRFYATPLSSRAH